MYYTGIRIDDSRKSLATKTMVRGLELDEFWQNFDLDLLLVSQKELAQFSYIFKGQVIKEPAILQCVYFFNLDLIFF